MLDKIAIFRNTSYVDLENSVNEFLMNEMHVHTVHYSTHYNVIQGEEIYSALVYYQDQC